MTKVAKERESGAGVTSARAARVAWSVCAASITLFGLSLVLMFLGRPAQVPEDWGSWQERVITAAGFLGVPIVGGLIASHRPANSYGWLWLGLGLAQPS